MGHTSSKYIYFALDYDIIKPLATIYQFGESKEERNIIDCESILKLKGYYYIFKATAQLEELIFLKRKNEITYTGRY